MKKKKIALISLFILLFISFFTNLWGNLLFLAIDEHNFIPPQSSIFTFEITGLSSGSSEEWVYGEDWSYYYFNPWTGNKEDVIAFQKENSKTCQGFDSQNVGSWCGIDIPNL